jgi:hypothetical protein
MGWNLWEHSVYENGARREGVQWYFDLQNVLLLPWLTPRIVIDFAILLLLNPASCKRLWTVLCESLQGVLWKWCETGRSCLLTWKKLSWGLIKKGSACKIAEFLSLNRRTVSYIIKRYRVPITTCVSSEKMIFDQCSLTFQWYFDLQNALLLPWLTLRIVIDFASLYKNGARREGVVYWPERNHHGAWSRRV